MVRAKAMSRQGCAAAEDATSPSSRDASFPPVPSDSGPVGAGDDGGGGPDTGGTGDDGDAASDSGPGPEPDSGPQGSDAGKVVDAGFDSGPGPVTCSPGETTTISGTVYDPAGNNPLYGVSVYVPSEPLTPFPTGVTCSCDGLYPLNPVTIAQTDANGAFTLKNVPNRSSVDVVMQIGKWRKKTTRWPSPRASPTRSRTRRAEAPDHPPRKATSRRSRSRPAAPIHSSACSSASGWPRRSTAAERATPGHIHIFQGSGTTGLGASPLPTRTHRGLTTSSTALWDSTADLSRYDMVFLSCEGAETASMNQAALFDYAAAGGASSPALPLRLVRHGGRVRGRRHGHLDPWDQ